MRASLLALVALSWLAASPAAGVTIREQPWDPPRDESPVRHRPYAESPCDFFVEVGGSTPQNLVASLGMPRTTHPAVGIGFRYAVEPGLSVGLSARYAVTASTTEGWGRDETRQLYAQVPVLAEVTLATPRGVVRPHVTAGGGLYVPTRWEYYVEPYEDLGSSHGTARWGYSLGAGAEIRTGKVGFSLDVAKHFINQDQGPDAKFVTVTGAFHFH